MDRTIKRNLFVGCVILMIFSTWAQAQQPHRSELQLNLGKAAFLDESTPFDHTLFGGSFRFYLTKRLATELEFAYLRGPGDDRDYLFFPNVVFDIAEFQRTRVFLIGGGGLLRQCDKFPGALDPEFCANDWTASGGIGAKIFLSENLFAGGDFRLGTEPIFRFTGSIGYAFDRTD